MRRERTKERLVRLDVGPVSHELEVARRLAVDVHRPFERVPPDLEARRRKDEVEARGEVLEQRGRRAQGEVPSKSGESGDDVNCCPSPSGYEKRAARASAPMQRGEQVGLRPEEVSRRGKRSSAIVFGGLYALPTPLPLL